MTIEIPRRRSLAISFGFTIFKLNVQFYLDNI